MMTFATRDEAEREAKLLRKRTRGRIHSNVMQAPTGSWYLQSRDQRQYDDGFRDGKADEPQRLWTVSYVSGYQDGKVVRERNINALEDHVSRKSKKR